MKQMITGTITLDSAPMAGVEIALVTRAGKTLAVTTSDAHGAFSFAAVDDEMVVLAKLERPIVGALVAAVGDQPVALELSTNDAVELSGVLQVPKDIAFDWADVHLTPRALVGVDDELVAALTLVGTGPSRKGTYHQVRVTEPRFSIRALPGAYDFKVEHLVERAPSLLPQPKNFASRSVRLPDGNLAQERLGSFRIPLRSSLNVTVELAAVSD